MFGRYESCGSSFSSRVGGLGLAGSGLGGVGAFGWRSLYMYQSQSCLSNAMWSQFARFPFGFCRWIVVVAPVILHFFVMVSLVSSGSRAFRLRTVAFLLDESTPDLGLGFLIHAVISSFGGWVSGERAVLPR